MHAGKLETSKVLQATLAVLRDGKWHTSAEFHAATGSMAVHSDIAGCRANGMTIDCEYHGKSNGRKVYKYRIPPTSDGWLDLPPLPKIEPIDVKLGEAIGTAIPDMSHSVNDTY